MTRPALFVAVTALLAALLAGAGAFLARSQDESINVWLSMGTALVIGSFLAFLILGPRSTKSKDEPAAEGFAVVAKEEVQPVMVPREGEEPSADAPPTAGRPRRKSER